MISKTQINRILSQNKKPVHLIKGETDMTLCGLRIHSGTGEILVRLAASKWGRKANFCKRCRKCRTR